jgi:GNAT superfamily N-acetyltransferase
MDAIRLEDGTTVLVRPIQPTDKARLAAGLTRLSETSRQRRFLGPKPRLTQAELRYLTEVDGHDHVALVALRLDEPQLLVAAARYVRLKDDPETAEVAVTVADDLQGKGVGRALGVMLADEARGRGVKRFSASVLHDNVPALRLIDAMWRRLESHMDHGVRELVADLAA